jgi:hypothetical protein
MPKEKTEIVQKGTSTLTLLLVAIAGGIIAVSLQPFILLLYSHLGVPTTLAPYQQSSAEITPLQASTTTTFVPVVTTKKTETTTTTTTTTTMTTTTTITTATTTTTTVKTTLVQNDPTVDEEPIILKEEPLTIKIPASTTTTTPKPIVNEKPKASDTKKVDKSEKESENIKLKKMDQQPELIDVTGRNKQIPDEVKNFKSTKISMSIPILTFTKAKKRISLLSLISHFIRHDKNKKTMDTYSKF